ncbi:toprim domain-containing protein [Sphingomonas sp.]|uniref:DUF7146 domain-containing protein n=1 Tax=Sphingomonas sp. TaxID=28214 RepID=UPI0031E3386F
MRSTKEAARGKWRGILLALGADERSLSGKHGPCPFCEGRDRFRWDNKDGSGSFICSHCGAGDGFEFLKRLKGWAFPEAAREIDRVVGNVRPEPVQKRMDDRERVEMLNRLWVGSTPITPFDLAGRYLAGRGLPMPQNFNCIRFTDRCPVPGGGYAPAMIAMVSKADGSPANLHRTFLGPNGKADMEDPRATMPGVLPDGCAVRLSMHGGRLGIAEGIETALKATQRFTMPVWAALNATMLAKWIPPIGVEEVVIFGDNDGNYTGQAAAYALARRLSTLPGRALAVRVEIPKRPGLDWADEDAA